MKKFLVEKEEAAEMIDNIYRRYSGDIGAGLEYDFVIDRIEYFAFLDLYLPENEMQKLYKRSNGEI